MVSTLTTKGIDLRLIPLQISESTTQRANGLGEAEDRSLEQHTEIVAYPGERCRVSVEIKNWESYPQHLILSLDGTFPLQWCQNRDQNLIAPNHGTANSGCGAIALTTVEILAKKSWSTDLWFLVPKDFFERQDALQGEHIDRLNLHFQGCLSVYASPNSSNGGRQPPLQQSDFSLSIRPNSTYTTFLPTVYQEVEVIHRFIKIFEQAFDPVVNSFNAMWAHLDPLTSPQALLPFLAHWVDWPIDTRFDLTQQRQLIRRAVEIYRWRGTRKGLRFYLHLYTGLPLDEEVNEEVDKSISITESFGQGCVVGIAHIGTDAVFGGGKPYHFQVRLRTSSELVIDEALVRRIIDQEKPAFCTYTLWIETI